VCLAVPGQLLSTFKENGLLMGKVDYSGTVKEACLEYVPEVSVGQFIIVHAGFAINVIDEKEANETLRILKELEEFQGSE
jgi:hydrogenase expression/formation protein HypC